MFLTKKKLLLASTSPRRQKYFNDLGLEYRIKTSEIDETPFPVESPGEFVRRMAHEKAAGVMGENTDCWVVAADTVVTIDQKILGKPRDSEGAVAMLMSLSGKTHSVLTGICLGCSDEKVDICHSVESLVRFSVLDEKTVRAYVATGESFDKAGAYGIQGQGAFLVEGISGSYSNIVGLPLAELLLLLTENKIIEPVPVL